MGSQSDSARCTSIRASAAQEHGLVKADTPWRSTETKSTRDAVQETKMFRICRRECSWPQTPLGNTLTPALPARGVPPPGITRAGHEASSPAIEGLKQRHRTTQPPATHVLHWHWRTADSNHNSAWARKATAHDAQ